jgi:hypothetical protein
MRLSLTASTIFVGILLHTSVKAQQPFEEYGYKAKVATLSNGKYQEFFDQDTLVQIGSIILNTVTNRIEFFVTYDTTYSEATLQAEVVSRWLSPDPLSEKFYSLSPYNYAANNPILFVDPNGAEINVYHWVEGKDGEEGRWEKGHMNEKAQKAFEAFAKTKEGRTFLSKYAKAGDKIGDVEFKEDGEFADQRLNYKQYDRANEDGEERGGTSISDYRGSKGVLDIDISMNTHYLDQENGQERFALTAGHESLLHADPYDDKLISAYKDAWNTHDFKNFNQEKRNYDRAAGDRGDNDHSRYINNQGGAAVKFNNYSSQLKSVMNPKAVEAAKRAHDSNYSNLKIK